jgi:cytochrome c-type biogenesis protein CcsB
MKHLRFLVTPAFMGVLFIVFAVSMAVATFIENDYGAKAAYGMVYGSKWFELILLLLAINLVGQLIIFKLFRASRLPGALFHLAFIVMLAGAAITRYTGWEGMMHIREGNEQNICLSAEKYLGYTVTDLSGELIAAEEDEFSMAAVHSVKYSKAIKAGPREYELILSKVVPNAMMDMAESPDGKEMVSLFVTDSGFQGETINLSKGETKSWGGITISFENPQPADFVIRIDSGKFIAQSASEMKEMSMMTKEEKTINPGDRVEMKRMQILAQNDVRIITRTLSLNAVIEPVSVNPEEQKTGMNAMVFDLRSGQEARRLYLWTSDRSDTVTAKAVMDGRMFTISYGPQQVKLPFYLKLNDFTLERYPGSNSPSGYKSDVVLLDKNENVQKPFLIYMNNILKYKGYRFYQSSYDTDEKGTILSVNRDIAGMLVTYAGYGLLILFIIISLLNRKSVFHNINSSYWTSNLRKTVTIIVLMIFIQSFSSASAQELVTRKEAADEFGKVLVQDQKGRTKPLFTLSSDILRKVTKDNKFEGKTPMQVFLGIYADFDHWKDVPLIRVANGEIQKKLGISGNMAAFSDVVELSTTGRYKISKDVETAYSKAPGERSKYDKEVMKVDERVNIVYMIYTGNLLRLLPLRAGSHDWGSPAEALEKAQSKQDSVYIAGISAALSTAIRNGNPNDMVRVRESISEYQKSHADYDLPSTAKTKAEVLYYKMNIFEKLFPFYASFGIIMLITLIVIVIRGTGKTSFILKVAVIHLFAGFLFHTFGLGLRWYISGHSPMSNGYESMLFISWVTLLAGFIFSRRSPFALSATAVLASMTLLVAHMSFMDPEITNLVPVLKSYWLTLHVSVITGSYGFLGLGAILGLIVLILMSLLTDSNKERISATIDELTVINYKSLTLGLYLLTIGTFLGAIWANESWGRYWGWDPKETWSLITIIIYSIVIHSRLIPGMKDIFTFNIIALFAFSSVLMTYFGVNYYLSGLHSYAGGDSVPVPSFVYITVAVLAVLAFVANSKYKLKGAGKIRTGQST